MHLAFKGCIIKRDDNQIEYEGVIMINRLLSDVGIELSALLQRKEEWTCGKYSLRHEPSGLELWISNGAPFLRIEAYPDALGFVDRQLLWWKWVKPLVFELRKPDPTAREDRENVLRIIRGCTDGSVSTSMEVAMMRPDYWGLPINAEFYVRRGDAVSETLCKFQDAVGFLNDCGLNLARDEFKVAAIFAGVPFDIDGAPVSFKLATG